ncbi:MAG TPA: histidine kinase dimerization/phospho-acceptor domain-containing protein, partial [Candidatus Saccharimonadales bacterium]|nr:histidine kinase dimerization/phospho-acceptor domain-containing protein [Candidatus Saccharimonadales bacterium]
MTSLKARLILAFSLVTLIPLAIAVAILTTRIQAMVRGQAEERLSAALEGIRGQADEDGRRIAARIEILARDPQLKRLYLLNPEGSRDLSDYLAERQVLLGLDLLAVKGPNGPANFGTPFVAPAESLGALAMSARSPILYQGSVEGVVEGGTLLDAALLTRLGKTSGVEWILRDAAGRTAATTLATLPSGAIPRVPAIGRADVAGRTYLSRSVPLAVGPPPHATVTGLASTATADRAVHSVWIASALLALLGLLIAIPLAIVGSAQISRPVERLALFSEKVARGNWDEPLELHSARELETLVVALDRMRRDLKTYREKLVTSERQAAWSQMARKVAHEVKNPLTPIAISIEDLKRSYDQKRPDFPEILNQAVRTIGEEVETLRRLLQEFSDFARIPSPRLEPCTISSLLGDLESLYGREVSAGRLVVERPGREIGFEADAGQIRQALINLVKNGLEALNGDGRVVV